MSSASPLGECNRLFGNRDKAKSSEIVGAVVKLLY